MSSQYNKYQQVFGLNLAANRLRGINGTQSTLQTAMEGYLQSLLPIIGNWECVWGPVVWKHQPQNANTPADNTWYVARCPNLVFEDGVSYDTYVVAIAATMSNFDWRVEDFEVNSVVDFLAWTRAGITTFPQKATQVPGGTYIAYGTAKATHTLLTTPVPSSAPGAGTTLYQYISSFTGPRSHSKIIFTGHSLAGALSPTIATALSQSRLLLPWNKDDCLTYPTAGASPGNANFASLYSSFYPPSSGSGYQVWNHNVINTTDVVPQAWCTDRSQTQNMYHIPTMYDYAPREVSVAVHAAIEALDIEKREYWPIQSRPFLSPIPFVRPRSQKEWNEQAGIQHVKSYEDYIGVYPPGLAVEVPGHSVSSMVTVESKAIALGPSAITPK